MTGTTKYFDFCNCQSMSFFGAYVIDPSFSRPSTPRWGESTFSQDKGDGRGAVQCILTVLTVPSWSSYCILQLLHIDLHTACIMHCILITHLQTANSLSWQSYPDFHQRKFHNSLRIWDVDWVSSRNNLQWRNPTSFKSVKDTSDNIGVGRLRHIHPHWCGCLESGLS